MTVSLVKRAFRSLFGTIVMFQLLWTVPMVVIFWDSVNYVGEPTFAGVLYLLSLWVGGGLVFAVAFWFTVSRPLIKRIERDAQDRDSADS